MQKVAIIGSGTMGSGIAYVTARAGISTRLYDPIPEQLTKAQAYHHKLVEREVEKGRLTKDEAEGTRARILYTGDLAKALSAVDLVVEAAPENIELKKKLFHEMEQYVGDQAILGSNTSSLPITEIATAVEKRERVIGIHFFNPAPVMQLIEIIQAMETSEATVQAVVEFAKKVGKEPVVVRDFPGFVTTRVGIMLVSEAIFALQEGVAERDALDKAMKLGYNLPMGPLALADLIGLDIVLHVLDALYANYKDDRYRAPILLRKMAQAGHLGRKTGKGFYEYPS
ncbi:MAG: 3-hydroxyacyl-CoA dehydrogenase family protein [Chloroflexi bacterium]|nr:3-hydroxyacyl-CoA dehydrogenase family protein [Chloroflexota bacterium]